MTINPRTGISLTLKRKIREKGDIFGTLFTFRQLCKDQESPPPAALLAHANTLDAHGQRVEVALRDATGPDSSYRLRPSQDQQHERDDDADGEDPTGNSERNGGFDLAGPAREGQQIDGGEGVDGVDSQRDQQEHPKKEVGERGETGLGLEIGQVLRGTPNVSARFDRIGVSLIRRPYNIVPLLFERDRGSLLTISAAGHSVSTTRPGQVPNEGSG